MIANVGHGMMNMDDTIVREIETVLCEAERAVRNVAASDWPLTRFRSPKAFGDILAESRGRLRAEGKIVAHDLGLIFGPTGPWDDVMCQEGAALADRLLVLLTQMDKE